MWVSILDHFSAIDQSLHDIAKDSHKGKAVVHADMTPSSMKKDFSAFKKAHDWFSETLSLDQEPDVLMSFSTGLFSKEGESSGEVNPDCALEVGTEIQQSLDGGCFTDKMSTKIKVKNLSYLRKSVKVSEATVVVDSLKLFNRLIAIADREISLQESLAYELTLLPL